MEDLLTIFIHINLTYQHTLLFTFMCSHLCVSAFLHTDVCTSVSTICTLSSILVCVCLITFVITCFCHSASLLISSAFRHSLPLVQTIHTNMSLCFEFAIILPFCKPSSSPRGILHWLECVCLYFAPLFLHTMSNTFYISWWHSALNSLYILLLAHHTSSAAQIS